MTRSRNAILALALLLCTSCATKVVTLPVSTSLGSLVRIEKKATVPTNRETISPKSGEVIYVLSFEGKNGFQIKDVAVPDLVRLTGFLTDDSDIGFDNFSGAQAPEIIRLVNLPLVDSGGKEITPVFVGSPTSQGTLSQQGIVFNGRVTGKGGKPWVTTGNLKFPEPKVTLVYIVPEGATLTLKDGNQQHPIN